MKALKQLLFLCLLAVLAACTDDALIPQSEVVPVSEDGSVDMISMVVPDIEMDATTRSKLYEDGDGMKFTWQENDAIGVVPMSGSPLRFPIHAENAGKNTALFDGGQWALRTDAKYAAFFPYNKDNYEKDAKSIAYSYYGQTQGNFSKYDFLATGAVKPSNGQVTFNMKRLSAILKIRITMPADSYGRYGSLVAPEAVFGVEGTLDLTGTDPVMNKSYSKMVSTQIAADKTSSSEWTYEVYLMIPATDLSGQSLTFRISSDEGDAYEAPLEGKNFEAGKAYLLEGTADEAKIRNRNLVHAAFSGTTYLYITDSNGDLCVNRSRGALNKITKIDVSTLWDANVCDEIGYFRNLEELDCAWNDITSLDVSRNTALKKLECYANDLTTLDVSNCKQLTELNCGGQKLTSIDVSNNPSLEYLDCYGGWLTSLDVSNNPNLKKLFCGLNSLTSIDVSNNSALETLECYSNKLTSLDVSNNPALESLECYSNNLTSLDLSNNPALRRLSCYINSLTSLDVSKNTNLEYLYCVFNQLTSLDLSNNPALEVLRCSSNNLTSLDISGNPVLEELTCQSNPITELRISTSVNSKLKYLDVSKCNKLEELYVRPASSTSSSSLRKLDVSGCTSLRRVNCENNILYSLDLSGCTAMTTLDCSNNELTSLDVSSNTSLTIMSSYKNLMSQLDITPCTSLRLMSVFCGSQYTNSDKTSSQTLTLTARADDTTSLQNIVLNSDVVVERQ